VNNIDGLELGLTLLLWIPLVLFLGLAPFVTWRRGGSKLRVALAFAVSLIPYVGWIVGATVALTTKRTNGLTSTTTEGGQGALSVGTPARHGVVAGTFGKVAVVAISVLTLIVSGIVGYYLGRQEGRAESPTWTDREIRATGNQNVGTLRCTYHMADGTVRVRESVITLSASPQFDPFSARTRDCPPLP
jgi:hypothetical protein